MTGARGIGPGDEHNPKIFSQIMLMLAYDLAQATPHSIARDCAADFARRNESGAKRAGIFHREHAQHQQLPPLRTTVLFHAIELRRVRQPTGFRK
jgi:hypothetical protein